MAQRRFGPTRGAGTSLEEKESQQQIEPGALGWCAYAGIMERGPVGKLILASNRATFLKKCGSIMEGSFLPDCALDYYDHANGAGGLALIRVTDGTERVATLTLYQRNGSVLTPMGRIDAANGGRWGGKEQNIAGTLDALGDLSETTLQLPSTIETNFATDELKGGYIELEAVANKRYEITGNTASGLITVMADSKMETDHAASANLRFYVVLENRTKHLAIEIGDGEENPDTEWSLSIYLDGEFVRKYGNLSTDPASARYWVNIINNDDANDEITCTNLINGAHTATQRPANYYGLISTVTTTVLTAIIHDMVINSPGGGNPTMTLGTTNDTMLDQTLTVTMTAATTGTVASDRYGALGNITLGVEFTSTNKYVPPFTVTAGATALSAGDTLVIHYKPFRKSALVGGRLYPDKVNAKRESYRITANDHKTITVASGSNLTTSGAANDQFMVVYPAQLRNGRDGNAGVLDSHYETQAWNVDTSPFNQLAGRGLGLVKFATPGVTATAVQKAGAAYAENKNHQYRYEIPSATVTEETALNYINDTLGRNDYAVTHFPSYGDVPDPDADAAREGKLKTVPLVGMILGREARIAADYRGYHKAAAGIDAKLNRVLKLPTGDKILNEELLNPAGINVIKKKKGNFVIWGDRTLSTTSSWKFKHQRELMSYYEQVLQENFDFIIFAINDATTDQSVIPVFQTYFLPEFQKRAVSGKNFQDAVKIKVDSEINTDAVRGEGDMFAELSLKLANTVERFNIKIGKQGIFESVA